jgi:abortive infection bacteriophage resistance protein
MYDLFWAAGFLEGEGSFNRSSSGSTERVSANQKDPECLQRLAAMFGGNVHARTYKNKAFIGTKYERLHHLEMYSWEVCGSVARGIMLTLFSLMSRRRKDQILKALNDQKDSGG